MLHKIRDLQLLGKNQKQKKNYFFHTLNHALRDCYKVQTNVCSLHCNSLLSIVLVADPSTRNLGFGFDMAYFIIYCTMNVKKSSHMNLKI